MVGGSLLRWEGFCCRGLWWRSRGGLRLTVKWGDCVPLHSLRGACGTQNLPRVPVPHLPLCIKEPEEGRSLWPERVTGWETPPGWRQGLPTPSPGGTGFDLLGWKPFVGWFASLFQTARFC